MALLTRAFQGHFHNTTDRGGRGIFCPPSELRNYWSDLQNSNSVRLIWKTYRRKPNDVDLRVTDDVTGQVKVKMLDDLAYLVLSRTTAVSNGNKSIQKRGSCLGHFKYHPELSVTIFKVKVIHGHEVKERIN